jgi:hypothetical protein
MRKLTKTELIAHREARAARAVTSPAVEVAPVAEVVAEPVAEPAVEVVAEVVAEPIVEEVAPVAEVATEEVAEVATEEVPAEDKPKRKSKKNDADAPAEEVASEEV